MSGMVGATGTTIRCRCWWPEARSRRSARRVLRQTGLEVIASGDAETLIIGGKSMGGRIASLIADEAEMADLW